MTRKTLSRFPSLSLNGRSASLLPADHPALTERRTIYPKSIVSVADNPDQWALKPASYNGKIGGVIRKGHWRDFPVYKLSLEERRTCPTTCAHWRSCYGNKMDKAMRMQAGPDLEARLAREVEALDVMHHKGFCIRLHEIGDFYSLSYVSLWRELLKRYETLHIWGYTARWQINDDPIAAALVTLARDAGWDRFAMRFSNAPVPFAAPTTITIEHPYQRPADSIVCPEQTGRTESCSTCGLCWATTKRIAFIHH